MKLFQWYSDALKNYGPGHIIVMAEDLAEAREKVLIEFYNYLKSENSYWSWYFNSDGTLDQDYTEDYDKLVDKFKKDISWEPREKDSGVIFVKGSE